MGLRKRCATCDRALIAFSGIYLHPPLPCAGVKDGMQMDISIMDSSLAEIFVDMYGKPDKNDYELLDDYEKLLSHPIIRFILKLFRIS